MNHLYIKPATPGLIVRHPERAFAIIPASGDFVPDNGYWRRRLMAGEVVETDPPAPDAPAPASSPVADGA